VDELKQEASKVNLNRSVRLDKATFVNNAKKFFEIHLSFYEAQTTERQRERYKPYFDRAKLIVEKCK